MFNTLIRLSMLLQSSKLGPLIRIVYKVTRDLCFRNRAIYRLLLLSIIYADISV